MTILDANRSEENDEPWRLVRMADVLSRVAHAVQKPNINLVLRGLYSLHDHKGFLTVHWKTKKAFEVGFAFVEDAWKAENEAAENVDHKLLDGTLLRGPDSTGGGGGVERCGECGAAM